MDTQKISCDILIAGGGPAGVPCAIAAARNGARIVLCQDRSVLGGNASSEVRMHIVGANGTGSFDRGEEMLCEAREGGIIEEIRLENSVRNPQRSASVFDLILYEKCRAEANLTLMLNTIVCGASVKNERITDAIAVRQSTEDRFIISADIFIDCTGDGRLGAEAGAPFMEGREGIDDFGESFALEKPDNKRLGSTILLQARKHDRPMPFIAPDWAREFSRDELKLRLYGNPGDEKPSHEYGYWWAEWGGELDTIKDNEMIRDELLAITLGIWDHVKNGTEEDDFDASHWALDWFGFLPGKRESRRFIGQHILTESDLMESRKFPDAIAYGGWSLDLHPPEGVDAPEKEPCVQHHVPKLYDIPLNACVSRDVENLLFAGRNISATHVAFASTRVMATCAVIGQGIGTAAAIAVRRKLNISDLTNEASAMEEIQQQLLRDDCYLIDIKNDDSSDMADSANISTSSGDGAECLSGQTRSVHGERGAPSKRARPGIHRWISEELPAWIQFDWADEAVEFSEIQLIFDTGLHRHLTLSHHDGYTSEMEWGTAQPETVRDYRIEALPFSGPNPVGSSTEPSWVLLHEETGNYQRLRRHAISHDGPISALRITVTTANGVDHARICEVRIH